jgi:hypothetical protein
MGSSKVRQPEMSVIEPIQNVKTRSDSYLATAISLKNLLQYPELLAIGLK